MENAVASERIDVATEHTTKLVEELKDEGNDVKLLNQKFPPVGCDRRAPPAKVGINMFRDKLEINAYSGTEGNLFSGCDSSSLSA